MSVKYKIFEGLKLVYAVGDGALNFYDLMNHIEELSNDPQYKPPMLKLVDYRRLKEYRLTTKDSEIFSAKKASLADRFMHERCAFVVPSDLGFGMARQHQAFVDEKKIQMEIFRNIEDAIKWLGVDVDVKDLIID